HGVKGYRFLRSECKTFLMINTSITGAAVDEICRETFYYLNKGRNLGNIFAMPEPFESLQFYLEGSIEIKNASDLTKTLTLIQSAIRNYIFPIVSSQGYSQLIENGITTNEIFDGPHLQNGWIPSAALGEKKNNVGAFELVSVISGVSGVDTVSGLTFLRNGITSKDAGSEKHQLIAVDVINSYNNGYLIITSNAQEKKSASTLSMNSTLGKTPT